MRNSEENKLRAALASPANVSNFHEFVEGSIKRVGDNSNGFKDHGVIRAYQDVIRGLLTPEVIAAAQPSIANLQKFADFERLTMCVVRCYELIDDILETLKTKHKQAEKEAYVRVTKSVLERISDSLNSKFYYKLDIFRLVDDIFHEIEDVLKDQRSIRSGLEETQKSNLKAISLAERERKLKNKKMVECGISKLSDLIRMPLTRLLTKPAGDGRDVFDSASFEDSLRDNIRRALTYGGSPQDKYVYFYVNDKRKKPYEFFKILYLQVQADLSLATTQICCFDPSVSQEEKHSVFFTDFQLESNPNSFLKAQKSLSNNIEVLCDDEMEYYDMPSKLLVAVYYLIYKQFGINGVKTDHYQRADQLLPSVVISSEQLFDFLSFIRSGYVGARPTAPSSASQALLSTIPLGGTPLLQSSSLRYNTHHSLLEIYGSGSAGSRGTAPLHDNYLRPVEPSAAVGGKLQKLLDQSANRLDQRMADTVQRGLSEYTGTIREERGQALERIEREKREREDRDREKREEREKRERERRDREEKEDRDRREREREEREKRDRDRREKEKEEKETRDRRLKEEREKREREDQERREREDRERKERDEKERILRAEREQREYQERENRDKERRERLERENQERLEREAKERQEKDERDRRDREQREIREKEAREKKEKEDLERREKEEKERAEQAIRDANERAAREQREKELRDLRDKEDRERREREQKEEEDRQQRELEQKAAREKAQREQDELRRKQEAEELERQQEAAAELARKEEADRIRREKEAQEAEERLQKQRDEAERKLKEDELAEAEKLKKQQEEAEALKKRDIEDEFGDSLGEFGESNKKLETKDAKAEAEIEDDFFDDFDLENSSPANKGAQAGKAVEEKKPTEVEVVESKPTKIVAEASKQEDEFFDDFDDMDDFTGSIDKKSVPQNPPAKPVPAVVTPAPPKPDSKKDEFDEFDDFDDFGQDPTPKKETKPAKPEVAKPVAPVVPKKRIAADDEFAFDDDDFGDLLDEDPKPAASKPEVVKAEPAKVEPVKEEPVVEEPPVNKAEIKGGIMALKRLASNQAKEPVPEPAVVPGENPRKDPRVIKVADMQLITQYLTQTQPISEDEVQFMMGNTPFDSAILQALFNEWIRSKVVFFLEFPETDEILVNAVDNKDNPSEFEANAQALGAELNKVLTHTFSEEGGNIDGIQYYFGAFQIIEGIEEEMVVFGIYDAKNNSVLLASIKPQLDAEALKESPRILSLANSLAQTVHFAVHGNIGPKITKNQIFIPSMTDGLGSFLEESCEDPMLRYIIMSYMILFEPATDRLDLAGMKASLELDEFDLTNATRFVLTMRNLDQANKLRIQLEETPELARPLMMAVENLATENKAQIVSKIAEAVTPPDQLLQIVTEDLQELLDKKETGVEKAFGMFEYCPTETCALVYFICLDDTEPALLIASTVSEEPINSKVIDHIKNTLAKAGHPQLQVYSEHPRNPFMKDQLEFLLFTWALQVADYGLSPLDAFRCVGYNECACVNELMAGLDVGGEFGAEEGLDPEQARIQGEESLGQEEGKDEPDEFGDIDLDDDDFGAKQAPPDKPPAYFVHSSLVAKQSE